MIRRNPGTVVVAAVLVALLVLALVLARAQGKLPLLTLDLTEHPNIFSGSCSRCSSSSGCSLGEKNDGGSWQRIGCI